MKLSFEKIALGVVALIWTPMLATLVYWGIDTLPILQKKFSDEVVCLQTDYIRNRVIVKSIENDYIQQFELTDDQFLNFSVQNTYHIEYTKYSSIFGSDKGKLLLNFSNMKAEK